MSNTAQDWLREFVPVDGFAPRQARRVFDSLADAGPLDRSVTFVPFGPRISMQVVIRAAGREYLLEGPLTISLEDADQDIFACHRTLPIHGYGRTATEALRTFAASFDQQYRALVECDVSELHESALPIRAELARLVRTVRDVP